MWVTVPTPIEGGTATECSSMSITCEEGKSQEKCAGVLHIGNSQKPECLRGQ